MLLGIQLGQLDERERLATLAAHIGYFNNAKKPKFTKIFNRKKEERELRKAYTETNADNNERLKIMNKIKSAFS